MKEAVNVSEQSTTNPTPSVQVQEIGLPEQASVGKVLLVAGATAGIAAGLFGLLTEKKEPTPVSKTESAREYLRTALDEAQNADFAKVTRKQRKEAEKALKKQQAKAKKSFDKQSKKAKKDAEKLVEQGKDVANTTSETLREEATSLLSAFKSGGLELDKALETFAESQLAARLREFGDEAKDYAEQSRKRGEKATNRVQDEVIPQARKAAEEAAHKVQDEIIPQAQKAAESATEKLQKDVLPQAKAAAEEASKVGKDKLAEVSEKARNEFIPQAQANTAEFADQARERLESVSDDAEKALSQATEKLEKKSKDASEAVKRGGRETRSLLLWTALAGILIFTVFLDEDQQKRLKEVAYEVFGEAREMYSDMRGDTTA